MSADSKENLKFVGINLPWVLVRKINSEAALAGDKKQDFWADILRRGLKARKLEAKNV